jgi:hypothetical protein
LAEAEIDEKYDGLRKAIPRDIFEDFSSQTDLYYEKQFDLQRCKFVDKFKVLLEKSNSTNDDHNPTKNY